MNRDYHIDWLHDKEASDIAAIERRAFSRGSRTGKKDIATQLAVAEPAGENLSLGLYSGSRLVGYFLIFLESERRNICSYTDVDAPEGLDLSGPGVYVADLAVLPDHRGKVNMLLGHLIPMLSSRSDTRGLPMDAFCQPDRLHSWTKLTRMAAHFEFKHTGTHSIETREKKRPLYWLTFEQTPKPRQGPIALAHGCAQRKRAAMQ